MLVITKCALVVLAGVYAMRASSVLFHPQPFQPLMIVAAFAFMMSVVLFQKPPTAPSWWLYTVIILCLVGVAANAILFFAPNRVHGTPTNLAFSAISIFGWAIVAIGFVAQIFAPTANVA